MITGLIRIIKYGFQNFFRNGWLSVATVAIVILTLLLFMGLAFFDAISKTAVVTLEDKIDISVYFKKGVEEENILNLEKNLESLEEIKSVEYVSEEKALALFKERHEDDATISQAIEELDENPLLASLNIKASDPTYYSFVASYVEAEEYLNIIERVTYAENKFAIDRLTRIVDTMQSIGFAITIILALIATLITFNTIRLAIYSNREELAIMRLVGAANKFINGPYLVTGILYGLVAAVLSIVIMIPFVSFADPHITNLIPEMSIKAYFDSNIFNFFMMQLLLGSFLGALSSAIAIRKYLKL